MTSQEVVHDNGKFLTARQEQNTCFFLVYIDISCWLIDISNHSDNAKTVSIMACLGCLKHNPGPTLRKSSQTSHVDCPTLNEYNITAHLNSPKEISKAKWHVLISCRYCYVGCLLSLWFITYASHDFDNTIYINDNLIKYFCCDSY